MPLGTRVATRAVMRVAFWSYVLVVLAILGTGVVYFTTQRFLPYHAQAFGQSWEQAPARTRDLYLVMVKAIGAPTFVTGLAIAVVLMVPWRRGERWARVAVPLLALAWALPMLVIAVSVRLSTGASTPWPALVLLVALVGVGAFSSAGAVRTR